MSTIAERLYNAMQIRGLKQTDLINRTGINKGSISCYLKGRYKPKQDNIYLLAKALSVNEAWLMGADDVEMDRKPDLKLSEISNLSTPAAYPIPILGTICAGRGVFCDEDFNGMFFVDSSIRADFCLNVSGDSMQDAHIYDGDKAFIKKDCDYINGKIYAVCLRSDTEAVLKRCFFYKEQIVLNSANTLYEPMIREPGDVFIIGECIGIYHPTT